MLKIFTTDMVNNNPISMFVSHSNSDNTIVDNITSVINDSYVELFLAHRDIGGGEEWKNVIRAKIRDCNGLVALVTPNFYKSEYTSQEVGAAWVLDKPILAIRVGETEPKGFITEKQWITYDSTYPYNTSGEIVKFALIETYGQKKTTDMLVNMLNDAGSFYESNYLADLLTFQPSLSSKHISKIYSALETNPQVSDAKYTKRKLIHLLLKYEK